MVAKYFRIRTSFDWMAATSWSTSRGHPSASRTCILLSASICICHFAVTATGADSRSVFSRQKPRKKGKHALVYDGSSRSEGDNELQARGVDWPSITTARADGNSGTRTPPGAKNACPCQIRVCATAILVPPTGARGRRQEGSTPRPLTSVSAQPSQYL